MVAQTVAHTPKYVHTCEQSQQRQMCGRLLSRDFVKNLHNRCAAGRLSISVWLRNVSL